MYDRLLHFARFYAILCLSLQNKDILQESACRSNAGVYVFRKKPQSVTIVTNDKYKNRILTRRLRGESYTYKLYYI